MFFVQPKHNLHADNSVRHNWWRLHACARNYQHRSESVTTQITASHLGATVLYLHYIITSVKPSDFVHLINIQHCDDTFCHVVRFSKYQTLVAKGHFQAKVHSVKMERISELVDIGSLIFFHMSKLWNPRSSDCNISGEAAGEIRNWSLYTNSVRFHAHWPGLRIRRCVLGLKTGQPDIAVTLISSQRLLHKMTISRAAVLIARLHARWTSKLSQETQYLASILSNTVIKYICRNISYAPGKSEFALEVTFDLDFHWVTRPWRRTLTNGSDFKYVVPRCRTCTKRKH